MQHWTAVSRLGLLGGALVLGVPFVSHNAWAARSSHDGAAHHSGGGHAVTVSASHNSAGHASVLLVSAHVGGGLKSGGFKNAVYTSRSGRKGPMHLAMAHQAMGHLASSRVFGISCVPYAREMSGIALTGNAVTWWDEAAGQYARGNAPEPGSVLNFRANASMRLGHVAVVAAVLSKREIEIDHANWWGPGASKGGISHNISVVDVSPNNDWTAVRVGLGHTGEYGSIYATYGFIYPRHDDGTAHLQTARAHRYDEVAEAPDASSPSAGLGGVMVDAPDRGIK